MQEVADYAGLHQSTVFRYLSALSTAGFVEPLKRESGYRLGLGVVELASVPSTRWTFASTPSRRRLRDHTKLLTNVAVLSHGDVVHIVSVAPPDIPYVYTEFGRRAVAHCTALGKAILAHMDVGDVLETIREFGWRPYTPNSITDEATLMSQLEQVRTHGYALDLEERRIGVRCVAAPIYDRSRQVVAAMSMSTRRDRHSERVMRDELAPAVVAAADRISYRLGDSESGAYL